MKYNFFSHSDKSTSSLATTSCGAKSSTRGTRRLYPLCSVFTLLLLSFLFLKSPVKTSADSINYSISPVSVFSVGFYTDNDNKLDYIAQIAIQYPANHIDYISCSFQLWNDNNTSSGLAAIINLNSVDYNSDIITIYTRLYQVGHDDPNSWFSSSYYLSYPYTDSIQIGNIFSNSSKIYLTSFVDYAYYDGLITSPVGPEYQVDLFLCYSNYHDDDGYYLTLNNIKSFYWVTPIYRSNSMEDYHRILLNKCIDEWGINSRFYLYYYYRSNHDYAHNIYQYIGPDSIYIPPPSLPNETIIDQTTTINFPNGDNITNNYYNNIENETTNNIISTFTDIDLSLDYDIDLDIRPSLSTMKGFVKDNEDNIEAVSLPLSKVPNDFLSYLSISIAMLLIAGLIHRFLG